MTARHTRRGFLKAAAATGAGLVLLTDARSARSYQANERLNLALVGVGGRGTWFVDTIPGLANVAAVCDVDRRKINEAFIRWAQSAKRLGGSSKPTERQRGGPYQRLIDQRPPAYDDFRTMLDKSGGKIDGVVVATPDHTHAVISAAAIKGGKHVFCEKPLTRTVHESRALRELARKHKVATSMGNQGTAAGPFRRALELVRDGTLGKIRDVHIWNDGGGADRKEPPQGEEPVPDYLSWDLWLGPAAQRPYHHQWLRRNAWRDFGTSQLGNWAPHSTNLAFMALKVHELWLGDGTQGSKRVVGVKARSSGINRLSFPKWEIVTWSIPARAEYPPITFTWHSGPGPGAKELVEPLMREAVGLDSRQRNLLRWAGLLIEGSKGRLVATGHNATFCLLPDERFRHIDRSRPGQVDASQGHERDWLAACTGGKPAWANFDYASALTEFLMLGNVATQIDRGFDFDPVAMKIINHAEADSLLSNEYRQGWTL